VEGASDGADLVVTGSTGTDLSVLEGTGTGTAQFAAPVTYPVAGSATATATADFDGDARADILYLDTAGDQLSLLSNVGGHFGFSTISVGPAGVSREVPTALLRIQAHHRGKAADGALELASFHFGFSDANGTTLTAAQLNALVSNLQVYADSNTNGTFELGSDTEVVAAAPLTLDADGRQHVVLPSGPLVSIGGGASRHYFVVVTTSPNAKEQNPNTLRITHVTSASSTADAAATNEPLHLEWTPDVSTNGAMLPVEVSAWSVE